MIQDKLRIYINPNMHEQEIINVFKPHINNKKVAIYSPFTDREVQKILIEAFPNNKFYKCTHFAKDIYEEDKLIKAMSVQHIEQGHPGIIALYENLKFKIYN